MRAGASIYVPVSLRDARFRGCRQRLARSSEKTPPVAGIEQ